jgi:hypothetical protein
LQAADGMEAEDRRLIADHLRNPLGRELLESPEGPRRRGQRLRGNGRRKRRSGRRWAGCWSRGRSCDGWAGRCRWHCPGRCCPRASRLRRRGRRQWDGPRRLWRGPRWTGTRSPCLGRSSALLLTRRGSGTEHHDRAEKCDGGAPGRPHRWLQVRVSCGNAPGVVQDTRDRTERKSRADYHNRHDPKSRLNDSQLRCVDEAIRDLQATRTSEARTIRRHVP